MSEFENEIRKNITKINSEEDLDSLIRSIKNTRVVMLGEGSHGTEEYYSLRRIISQRLIKDHGFSFIAVEGDWPDAYRLNKYILNGEGENAQTILRRNHRWPTWMWANTEIVKLAEWMKEEGAGFYGLDMYSLFESIDEVLNYLRKNSPELVAEFEKRYACFDTYEQNEIAYARSLVKLPAGCEMEVLKNLQKILEIRLKDLEKSADDLFNAQQNAQIIANAETYYRSMFASNEEGWNLRDGHMMETLDRLLERAGEGSKAIVWAHNSHIGDYRATDMVESGFINLGGLARLSYGEENVALIGFGSYQGEVLAGRVWDGPEQIMPLPPAKSGSYEYHFHNIAVKEKVNQFYLILKDQQLVTPRLGHRAVGVVYNPQFESRGNYVPTVLSKRYDAFIFIDQTHALKSLHSLFVRGEVPDTWPLGF